jgi:hypothetical protein
LATSEIFLKQRGECKTGTRAKILQFPDRRIGLVVVFSIDEKVAYTMLMEAKSPVRARDILKMPRDQIVR